MGMPSAAANGLLKLLLQNTTFAGVGDGTGLIGSGVAGNVYLTWHTAAVPVGGSQTSNETAYTGYARKAIPRASGNFTFTANVATLAVDVVSGECTASPGATLTHWAIGTASSGAGVVLFAGEADPTVSMEVGTEPALKAGTTITWT